MITSNNRSWWFFAVLCKKTFNLYMYFKLYIHKVYRDLNSSSASLLTEPFLTGPLSFFPTLVFAPQLNKEGDSY